MVYVVGGVVVVVDLGMEGCTYSYDWSSRHISSMVRRERDAAWLEAIRDVERCVSLLAVSVSLFLVGADIFSFFCLFFANFENLSLLLLVMVMVVLLLILMECWAHCYCI